jgi:DtxR family Mn-dependent transcriptional regulator
MPEDTVTEVTSLPELEATSEAEQMYLITVACAAEAGREGPVPISTIAGTLGVSVPSTNEMVRRLDTRGLLTYEPYRGVHLSEAGNRVAGQVLRTRRLWATFLAEHLGFSPSDADDQACHLEHATTPEASNRLAAFLGNPEAGPLGRPIPAASASDSPRPNVRLTDLPVGASAEVVSITAPVQALEFLNAEGVNAGCHVTVAAAGASGHLVEHDEGVVHLNHVIGATIEVQPSAARKGP